MTLLAESVRKISAASLLAALLMAFPARPQPPTTDFPPPRTNSGAYQHTQPEPPKVDPGGGHELRDSLATGGAGLLAGILLGRAMNHGPNPEKLLSEQGPQFPPIFSMSTISVLGFVQGSWPMALDYEIREPGVYLLTITAGNVAPFFYLLNSSTTGRKIEALVIPSRFGTSPVPATCSLRAITNTPGEARPIYMRVFGWACGPRAVGSIAIDQLRFEPAEVRPKQKQFALYGFHSHADFEKVSAEFEAVGLIDGSVVAKLEDTQKIDDPVRINTQISNKRWEAKKASIGQHLLQVRAWYSLQKGGNWVIAWSPQIVRVEE